MCYLNEFKPVSAPVLGRRYDQVSFLKYQYLPAEVLVKKVLKHEQNSN
jgi:hypothetical protein